jgi:hypothetical protein
MYEVTYDGVDIAAVRPLCRSSGQRSTSAPVADLAAPYPRNQLLPLTEGRPRPPQRRGLPLHNARCFLASGHDQFRPVAKRPAEQVCTMVRDGLRRTGYDEVSLTSRRPPTSGIEPLVGGILADAAATATVRAAPAASPSTCIAAGRRLHRRPGGEVSKRSSQRADVRSEAGSWRCCAR